MRNENKGCHGTLTVIFYRMDGFIKTKGLCGDMIINISPDNHFFHFVAIADDSLFSM